MERITDTVKPKGALKPRVETAVKRLQAQIAKMDGMVNKLKQRDQEIFQKIVVATQQHDTYSSKILSNELVEVRNCLLYTSPSPRDGLLSRMPSSA